MTTLVLIAFSGCQPSTAVFQSAQLPTVQPTAQPLPPPATQPPLPTPLPTTAPTATAVIPPSPTPQPLYIAVPPEWETSVSAAAGAVSQPWEIILHAQPTTLLQSGRADAALDWNSDGLLIQQSPIV
ncbi:MAG: hypothetical protein KC421_23375, partial [Anaerolineales bacterium]|nr:hypothetical protein [Anaerolineales bacterium]